MQEKLEQAGKVISSTTYWISGGLVAGDWLSFLDNHAAAIGAILAAMTFVTNFIFQVLNHRAIKAKIQEPE